jgi:hypothetical protein
MRIEVSVKTLRSLRRHRHGWEDNIKRDLKGKACDGVDRIQVAEDGVQLQAVVNTVMNLRVL